MCIGPTYSDSGYCGNPTRLCFGCDAGKSNFGSIDGEISDWDSRNTRCFWSAECCGLGCQSIQFHIGIRKAFDLERFPMSRTSSAPPVVLVPARMTSCDASAITFFEPVTLPCSVLGLM